MDGERVKVIDMLLPFVLPAIHVFLPKDYHTSVQSANSLSERAVVTSITAMPKFPEGIWGYGVKGVVSLNHPSLPPLFTVYPQKLRNARDGVQNVVSIP